MNLPFKRSRITNWWVAREKFKMEFVNILSEEPLKGKLIIVGYLDEEKIELATNTERVIRITKDGVVTSKGTFYSFEEAHQQYLQFLIQVNKENTAIAINWDYSRKSNKNRIMIVADLVKEGVVTKKIEFDFYPDGKTKVLMGGYSDKLEENIVINSFARRNVCTRIYIPETVKLDIYFSSMVLYEESVRRIQKVKEIFEMKFKELGNCVEVID